MKIKKCIRRCRQKTELETIPDVAGGLAKYAKYPAAPFGKVRKEVWRKVARIRAWQARDIRIGVKSHDESQNELIEIARRIDSGNLPGKAIERWYFDDAKNFLRYVKVKRKYESDLAESLYEAAADLHEIGLLDEGSMSKISENSITDCWRRWNGGAREDRKTGKQ